MSIKQNVKLRFKSNQDRMVVENLAAISKMSLPEYVMRSIHYYSSALIQQIETRRAEAAAKAKEQGDGEHQPQSTEGTDTAGQAAADSAALAHKEDNHSNPA